MNKKVPLIIGAGHGWCATTPLHLTLSCANKCSHPGILKEPHFLMNIYDPSVWQWREPSYKRFVGNSMTSKKLHHNIDEIKEFYTRSPNLKIYVKYYKRHYERVKHKFKYVHDFSNSNANLPKDFIAKIAPTLKKHFDIKVLKIFRDPTRRLYSEMSQRYQDSKELQNSYSTSKEYWRSDPQQHV